MKQNIKTYSSDAIDVTYDTKRCIHAAECVKRLKAVFDPEKRPWIQPENADPDLVARTIEYCPTGSLHYQRRYDGEPEATPQDDTIRIVADGPLYVRGDLTLKDHQGRVLLNDTRMALCRCGASNNKPLCDNSHHSARFEATDDLAQNMENSKELDAHHNSALFITATEDGSLHLQGSFEIYSADGETVYTNTEAWLCRCGHSSNKPFCDGSHEDVGFSGENEGED